MRVVRIHVLFNNYATVRTQIQHHIASQQLTMSIVDASTNKGVLGKLVNNSMLLAQCVVYCASIHSFLVVEWEIVTSYSCCCCPLPYTAPLTLLLFQ